MKYDKVQYSIDSKSAEGIITIFFTDIDPGMPQMENMITREVRLTIQEWAQLERDVRNMAGINVVERWTTDPRADSVEIGGEGEGG